MSGGTIVLNILRVLMGLLFIFSGLVKANDPSGLANKMTEFFEVFAQDFKAAGMGWGHSLMFSMAEHSLGFSVVLIASEIILGITLIIGFLWRFFAWPMFLINLFFTFLTAYIYYWDVIRHSAKVRECGCFGDCIKITNEETFWKDVILLIVSILLLIWAKRIRPLLPKYPNTAVFILGVFFAAGVQWWVLEHLPFYDCMPYSVGKDVCAGIKPPPGSHPDVFETKIFYKNLQTNDSQGFTAETIPWEDTLHWAYSSTSTVLVKKGNADPEIKDFKPTDYDGNDMTDPMLQEPGYKFLIFLKDPAHAREDNLDKLRALSAEASAKGIPVFILSSGSKEANAAWAQKARLASAEFYIFDMTSSKTAMRTDPGLLLLQGCVIRGKWSFRDYPTTMVEAGVK